MVAGARAVSPFAISVCLDRERRGTLYVRKNARRTGPRGTRSLLSYLPYIRRGNGTAARFGLSPGLPDGGSHLPGLHTDSSSFGTVSLPLCTGHRSDLPGWP